MKQRTYSLDKYGNKADWQFQVDVEFDSSCDIEIVAIHEYVPTTDRWIDSTEYIKKLETLFITLSTAAIELTREETAYQEYEAELDDSGLDDAIDSYRDSRL